MQLIWGGQDLVSSSGNMRPFRVQGPSTATRNDGMSIWYDPTVLSDTTPRVRVGSWWFDESNGNTYQYVKCVADGGLNMGQLVAAAAPAADTVASTGTDLDYIVLTTGGLTTNAEKGNYLWCAGAAAGGTTGAANLSVQSLRKIKANTSDTDTLAKAVYVALPNANGTPAYDGDLLHAAPTAATDCLIIRPYNVIVSTAATVPVGVALGPVAINTYTMIQKSGLALILAKGDGTATVANQPATVGAGGIIIGTAVTITTTAYPGLYTTAASIVPQYAWNGAAPTLIPCLVNFIGV